MFAACDLSSDPAVERVGELLTMQMGPQQALLTVKIPFHRALDVQEIETAIGRIKRHIRDKEPAVEKIFIDPEQFPKRRDEAA